MSSIKGESEDERASAGDEWNEESFFGIGSLKFQFSCSLKFKHSRLNQSGVLYVECRNYK